ncbi:nuclease-related domain-containing protein [Microbacterium aoyamense]
MRLRYAGTCRRCGATLSSGSEAIYERATKTVRCEQCSSLTEAHSGTAGASARREHERRRDRREERIRTEHPKLGGLILALTDDPQSTRAWQQGAVGEELLAHRLGDLPEAFRVLHDRRIPGTRANIDHIAIGSHGVWVIDAKRYKGKRPTLHVTGGILRPRVESLRVDGRDRTKLVDGVRSQVARVKTAIADDAVPVHGALCFIDADWPLIGGSFTIDDVLVTWPRNLIKRMTEDSTTPIDTDTIHARLARAFPTA